MKMRNFPFSACLVRAEQAIKGLVIRHPQIRKGHIHFKFCTPGGLDHNKQKNQEITLSLSSNYLINWGAIRDSNPGPVD